MSKEENYQELVANIKAIIEGETDLIAVMSNIAAEIHQTMKFWWTGFYRVKDGELILGPFQGPVACMHIAYGRGVCGTAWKKEETIIVPDVEQFPGHIACSSQSRSEIVVPVFNKENNAALLTAITLAEVDISPLGFHKQKGGEKLAESEDDPLEYRTDGTDAFDTLLLGNVLYPYSTSVVGVGAGI